MNPAKPRPLPPERLRRRVDPARIPFETTEGLEALPEPLGQARAIDAIRFGTGMRRDGFNVFAMGPAQTGRHALVEALLAERARAEPVPDDVCYVHDFERPDRPKALILPPGKARELERDVDALVEDLRTAIPAALEGEEHRRRKDALADEFKERHDRALADLRGEAEKHGVALLRTPLGFGFAPIKDGEVVTPEQYESLPPGERERLEKDSDALQERLRDFVRALPRGEKDLRERLRDLVREATLRAVGHLIDDVKARHASLPAVVAHLDALQRDVVEHADDFLRPLEGPALPGLAGMDAGEPPGRPAFRRYRVNVLVDNAPDPRKDATHDATRDGGKGGVERRRPGAPVIHEVHPTYQNLVGRVDHIAQFGALVTDFLLVKAGALHRANGGYLVLDARDLLLQPYAWEGLKRALKSREVRIESLAQMLSLVSTVSLEPEPIPLRVKVVLVGERLLYHLLDAVDPDFRALFKVAADFEDDLERSDAGDLAYARLVAALAAREGLRPLDRGAVAAVLERSARMADDSTRLTARVEEVADLLREADHRAATSDARVVSAEHVEGAVAEQERRDGRVRERVLDEIRRGTVLIDTAGAKVGQVNGLSVVEIGRTATGRFGRPTRITARVRLGKGEVVDIEREADLGGPIHSKGVMILSGWLGARYAREHPLSLSATIVFEQSYGPVEGDSASSAELYAILSALAEVPVLQSLAVTGSVNQNGEVQAVGGVNEKIEGFFEVCRARGLTGEQGVIVPAANVRHLMLRRDVVEAAAAGRFRVIPVETVDQGIEVLTGVPAGERDAEGEFPEGSVNARVEARLVALAQRRAAIAAAVRAEVP